MDNLAIIWLVLAGVLLAVYAVLDGFDLGIGTLFAFAKNEEEKSVYLASIGPVWNGNEVWAIGAVGSLLASFPPVYATLLSTLYVPVYLLLASILIRAVAIEYRSMVKSAALKAWLDGGIVGASAFVAFAVGFVGGNVLHGLPFDTAMVPQGNFLALFHPLSIAGGLTSLVFFCLHGASWLTVKTEGETAARAYGFVKVLRAAFPAMLVITAVVSAFATAPQVLAGICGKPAVWIFGILTAAAITLSIVFGAMKKNGAAFVSTGATAALLTGLAVSVLFPAMLPSSFDPSATLTVFNAAASEKALTANFITAAIGVPIVIGYTIFAYFLFRGKTKNSSHY